MDQPSPHHAILEEQIRGVREDVQEVKVAVQELSKATLLLIKVEQRQVQQHEALDALRGRVLTVEHSVEAFRRDVPALKEMRTWVVRGVAAIVLGAVLAVVNGNVTIGVVSKQVTPAATVKSAS